MRRFIFIIAALWCSLSFAGDGTSLSGRFMVWPQWTYSKTAGVATVTAGFPQQLVTFQTTDGTNAYQMNALVARTITIEASGTNTVDLYAETNAFGDPVSFFRVNMLCISSRTNNTGTTTVGGADFSSIFEGDGTGVATLRPGGSIVFVAPDADGYAVATNSRNLMFSNTTTNEMILDVYIGGAK